MKRLLFYSLLALGLTLLLAPVFMTGEVASAEPDCPQPQLSHVCVEATGQPQIAEVVWPQAPDGVKGSTGVLTATRMVSTTQVTFTIPLTWSRWTGPTAHWTGTVPITGTGTFTVTAGSVAGHQIANLPKSYRFGETCSPPTAVVISSFTATYEEKPWWTWLVRLFVPDF